MARIRMMAGRGRLPRRCATMDPSMFGQMGGDGGLDMAAMIDGFWDSPLVAQFAFQPRPQTKGAELGTGQTDGEIDCDGGGTCGYRMYGMEPSKCGAVVVYFHGNAEICTDLSHAISSFHGAGVAALSVDFRGYGWSKGQPSMKKLCPDAEKVHAAVPAILEAAGLTGIPIVLFGRSMGATCAVHLGTTHPEAYAGVILESGLQTVKDLPMLAPLSMMIPNGQQMLAMVPEPLGTLEKMQSLTLPLLMIHGDRDEIVPLRQAQAAHRCCPSTDKTLTQLSGGHNDLLLVAADKYFDAVKTFVTKLTAPPVTAEAVAEMGVKELKSALASRGVDFSHCVEKSELVALLQGTL